MSKTRKTRVHAGACFGPGNNIAATVIVRPGESIKEATARVMKKIESLERKYPRKGMIPTYSTAVEE